MSNKDRREIDSHKIDNSNKIKSKDNSKDNSDNNMAALTSAPGHYPYEEPVYHGDGYVHTNQQPTMGQYYPPASTDEHGNYPHHAVMIHQYVQENGYVPPPPPHQHQQQQHQQYYHPHPPPPVYYGSWPMMSTSPPTHTINQAPHIIHAHAHHPHPVQVYHYSSYPPPPPPPVLVSQNSQGSSNSNYQQRPRQNQNNHHKLSRKNSYSKSYPPSDHHPSTMQHQHQNNYQQWTVNALAEQINSFELGSESSTTFTGSPGTVPGSGASGAAATAINLDIKNALFFIKRNPGATLFSIDGAIAGVATDPDGSRFVQKRIKLGSDDERKLALKEAILSITTLWQDTSGNYILQQLLEHGNQDVKKELMEAIEKEDVIALSLHMHGCRVIQKAIKCLDQKDVTNLITKFHSQVLPFIHDPNGNHVIQKCIQVMSSLAQQEIAASEYDSEEWTAAKPDLSDQLQFVIDDVVANVESLSKHRYGCRVVQRAIEFCVEKQKAVVLDHIIQCHELLVDDQYGNYVVQQSLVCGSDKHQAAILKTLTKDYGSFVRYSKHKYASNVVEAMLKYGSVHHKGLILDELLKPSNPDIAGLSPCCAVELALDPIANYVVKSSLECVNNEEKVSKLMDSLNSHRLELTRSPFAKYVVAKINKRDKSVPEASKQVVLGDQKF